MNYPQLSRRLRLEPLEDRSLLSVSLPLGPSVPSGSAAARNSTPLPAQVAPAVPPAVYYHVAEPVLSGDGGGIVPMYTQTGMTPSQVRKAYGVDPPITINGITGDGTGQTIAIIDAYKSTTITSDLTAFDNYFTPHIPAPPNFLVLNQNGGTDLSGVSTNSGWATEISLDVEWAHAMAPAANIVLFEANDNSSGLYTAIATARTYTTTVLTNAPISVMSMSWGGSEFSGETYYDSADFATPLGHTGITFVASTGDNGAPPSYPSASPNVLAVGGTTLDIKDSTGTYNTESGWSGSGGGISAYESMPSYQNSVPNYGGGMREVPDVAFDASNSSSVQVFIGGSRYDVWGTSLAAPCWAGLIAIANEFRVHVPNATLGTLNPYGNPTQLLSLLYQFAGTPSNYNALGYYNDINTGGSTGSPPYSCVNGYDLVTGIGTPVANLLLPALAPGAPALAPAYDTGISNSDDITNLNNHNMLTELQFTVPNTVSGATVTIYADGTAIGSATASGSSTTVTTSGSFTLTDGSHSITAQQTMSGWTQSLGSQALTIIIDTTPPTVTVNLAAGQTNPVHVTLTINFSAVFDEPVFNFTGGVTLGGTAGASSVVITNPSGDHMNYNLAVSGTTRAGTVIVSLAAGVAEDTAGNLNLASTGMGNTVTVVGTTRTWGGGGGDNNWMTAANWDNNVAPIAGDVLVFAGSTRTSPHDNFPDGTVFDSITFANGGFTLSGGNVKLTPAGGVAITNTTGQNGIDLSIASGSNGSVVVQAGALRLGLNAQGIVLSGGVADIRTGKLIFDYTGGSTPAATILALLTASYHGGAWDIGSFRSTKAVANGTTLGWIDYTASSQVTVMATIPGDFNLDGTVDSSDLAILYANVWTGTTSAQGDANYDGTVNGLDRDILVANLSRSVSSNAPSSSPLPSPAGSGASNPDLGASPSGNSNAAGQGSSATTPQTKPAYTLPPANASDVSAANVGLKAARAAVFTGLATAPGGLLDGALWG